MNNDNLHTAASAWLNALDQGFPANTPTKPFMCSYPGCNKTFARASTRQNHFKAAHVDVRHVCIECGETFESTDDLKKHEELSHPGLEYWECSPRTNIRSGCACGRRFQTREALHRHQRSFIASEPGSPTSVLNRQSDQTLGGQAMVEDALRLGLQNTHAGRYEGLPEDPDHAKPLEFTEGPLLSSAEAESHVSRSYQPFDAAAHGSSIAQFFVVDRPGAAQSKSS